MALPTSLDLSRWGWSPCWPEVTAATQPSGHLHGCFLHHDAPRGSACCGCAAALPTRLPPRALSPRAPQLQAARARTLALA
eukprot:355922-Chlamydomonas_euryale.AAC.4